MKTSTEMTYIKNRFANLDRTTRMGILEDSNLNDREVQLLKQRLINGLSLKECADTFKIEINTVSKNQTKAIRKLYFFLNPDIHKLS